MMTHSPGPALTGGCRSEMGGWEHDPEKSRVTRARTHISIGLLCPLHSECSASADIVELPLRATTDLSQESLPLGLLSADGGFAAYVVELPMVRKKQQAPVPFKN